MLFVVSISMKLFISARIKLTLLYLLISILISSFFSVLIYRMISQELEWGLYQGALVQRAHELNIKVPRHMPRRFQELDPRLNVEDVCPECDELLSEAKRDFLVRLGVVNVAIWVFSAGAGYFLAGKALEPLEQSMEEQKRFVADASHELRTPLTALKTQIEVALRDKNTDLGSQQNVLESSLEDLEQLELLTEGLLNLSRYTEVGRSLDFEDVNLKKLVEKEGKKVENQADKKDINFRLDLADITLHGSQEHLRKMISIFLDNAFKYTETGGKVAVTMKAAKNFAVIEVSDTGVGIQEKDIPHIFDRFYRADSSRTKQKVPGFGLGLSVAKRIIELHNGAVEVESTPGEGTTFTVKLPLTK